MNKNSGMTFQQITLHDEHSIFIHTPIVQTTLVPGVGKDSQFVRELWRIADLYAARIVARRQLGLPLVPQPPVSSKHDTIRILWDSIGMCGKSPAIGPKDKNYVHLNFRWKGCLVSDTSTTMAHIVVPSVTQVYVSILISCVRLYRCFIRYYYNRSEKRILKPTLTCLCRLRCKILIAQAMI
jgi:hypothetical protein